MQSPAPMEYSAELLRKEAAQYQVLLNILKAEQQVLVQGAVEEINRICEEKSLCVAGIDALEQQRQALSDNDTCKLDPSLSDLWQQLNHIATQARELNLANGRVINARLQRTQDALSILRTDERDPTYGPDGQAAPSGSGRPIASA